jgi:hypothetical protein
VFQRLKHHFKNADNVIDASVDVVLLLLEFLATPVLIPIRIARFYIKMSINRFIKKFFKKIYHKIYDGPKKEPKAHYDERQGWTIQEK